MFCSIFSDSKDQAIRNAANASGKEMCTTGAFLLVCTLPRRLSYITQVELYKTHWGHLIFRFLHDVRHSLRRYALRPSWNLQHELSLNPRNVALDVACISSVWIPKCIRSCMLKTSLLTRPSYPTGECSQLWKCHAVVVRGYSIHDIPVASTLRVLNSYYTRMRLY